MQPKKFRYDPRNVFPDLQAYLFSRDDSYGTISSTNYPVLVDLLIKHVSVALTDPETREYMLKKVDIPDRVRVLLDGVGILPKTEINRRWDILQAMYRDYAKNWRAPIVSAAIGDANYL